MAPDDVETATQYARGFDRGNYGNAYESGDWDSWSERNDFAEHSTAYQDGMLMGYFSSYELDEISDDDVRDRVEALRAKHSAE